MSTESFITMVDKPIDMTSSDCVVTLRRHLGIKKVGHGGTLDPFASGLLPVFFGQFTKLASLFHQAQKEYVATVQLGSQTDTGDLTGKVVKTSRYHSPSPMQCQLLERQLLGKVRLRIPDYSARKIEGKPMYKLAREGKLAKHNHFQTVDIAQLSIELVAKDKLLVRATVSTGTYMRSLGELIAQKLQTCGHLAELRRTAYLMPSGLRITSAASMTGFDQEREDHSFFREDLSQLLPAIALPRPLYRSFQLGALHKIAHVTDGWYRLTRYDTSLLGLAYVERLRIKNRLLHV